LISLYHPELVRGGAQTIAYELFQGLRARPGISVNLLTSIDQTSPALYKAGARITGFDGRPSEFLFLSRDYDYAWEKSGDEHLAEAFEDFLRLLQPDVVHFHHFMTFGIDYLTLTRRVLPAARIVFTAHEFLTICAANGHMVRRTDQSLCARASAVRCHQCLPVLPPEHYFIREMWMKAHLAVVDMITVPSRFMIAPFVAWGVPVKTLVHVTNGTDLPAPAAAVTREKRNCFGFFGQLVDVKGVHVLLAAVEILRAEGFTDFSVEINGDNAQFATPGRRAELEAFMAAEGALPFAARRVTFNGSYHPDQLPALMARIDWCVVPSVWWEIFCLVISEAWHFGRPVIAGDRGGPAERITDGVDGLLFGIGDARALAAIMRRASTEPGLWERLAGGIASPAGRDEMVEGMAAVYRGGGVSRLAAA
jgi:glycosyltransferase involved in cell wall biosynthesis